MRAININKDKYLMIRVTKKEALALIKSLSNQLLENNCNSGRLESPASGDFNFISIAVNDELAK
jgi:hypothetical protein